MSPDFKITIKEKKEKKLITRSQKSDVAHTHNMLDMEIVFFLQTNNYK